MTDLKPGWERVKFGDVVRLVRETCQDPANAGIERVIGLEHLQPSDLRVRSWASVADGTTFTSRVRPGQVLFGKRRAYQRKVAVADFDAVCSGDIYLFESANPVRLLPALLPFICQTDDFFDHAVGTSAGSLSPRTNWTSLAAYEFALPPLEEQQRIAILCAFVNTANESFAAAQRETASMREAVLHEFFPSSVSRGIPLQEWCEKTITYGIVQAGPHVENGVPYIRVSDMTLGPTLSPEGMLRTSPSIAAKFSRSRVDAGDIVVALRGPIGLPMVVPAELDGANLTQGTARVAVRERDSRDYIFWALQAPSIRRVMTGNAKGSTFSEITLAALRAVPIPSADRLTQARVSETMRKIAECESALSRRVVRALRQSTSVMHATLGGN